jgi:hypothetical protein
VERRNTTVLAMERDHRAEVEARENVAVEDEERIRDVVGEVSQRSGGAERRCFDDVGDTHADSRAVSKTVLDRAW